MEYTDQEIEMLFNAVLTGASSVERASPDLREQIRLSVQLLVNGPASKHPRDPYTLTLKSAARLMREARHEGRLDAAKEHMAASNALHSERDAQEDRAVEEAREQGAAEMRERAALVALQPDICPVDGPVAAERIRALPLMPTTTNGNVNQGGDCAKCTVCGWTGRSLLPFESLPPKGACPSCGGMAAGISVPQ